MNPGSREEGSNPGFPGGLVSMTERYRTLTLAHWSRGSCTKPGRGREPRAIRTPPRN